MDKIVQKMFNKKRFILDLIDDVDLTLCKYNIGDSKARGQLAKDIEPMVVKHIENLRAEILDMDRNVWSKAGSNGVCNFSCT